MIKALTLLSVLCFFAGVSAPTFCAETKTNYSIDSAKSKVEIHVAKDGFLRAFGHDHLVSATQFSGEVQFASAKPESSSINFAVDTQSLVVLDPGESEKDRKEVQETMLGPQVLNAASFEKIRFNSDSVRVVSNRNGVLDLQVEGTLDLHGVKKSLKLPVRAEFAQDGSLSAYTEVSFLQSDFGITPYKAAGGAVRVKDKLRLVFHIVAQRASS